MVRKVVIGGSCALAAATATSLARPLVAVLELRAWARENPEMLNGGAALRSIEIALARDGYL